MDKNPSDSHKTSNVASHEELLALVAGTLSVEDFDRVSTAIQSNQALQTELAHLEQIHSSLVRVMPTQKSAEELEAFSEKLLDRINCKVPLKAKNSGSSVLAIWFDRLFSPTSARWAFGVVAAQTIGIAWLATGALSVDKQVTSSTRSLTPDAMHSGVVIFAVTFSPNTTESTMRGLLRDIEAQIISGPSQLGQYRVAVVRNRSDVALLKLRQAVFIDQFSEVKEDGSQAPPKRINPDDK